MIFRLLIIFTIMLANFEVFAEAESAASVIVCARVEQLDIVSPKKKGEANRFPFFVKVRVLKQVRGMAAEQFSVGKNSEFRIHSPVKTFKETKKNIKGQIFKVEFIKSGKNWVFANAIKDPIICSQ